MPDRLPVPDELLHLIEKRDVDSPSGGERRSAEERRQVDLGPIGAIQTAFNLEEVSLEDRRVGRKRRVRRDRRNSQ